MDAPSSPRSPEPGHESCGNHPDGSQSKSSSNGSLSPLSPRKLETGSPPSPFKPSAPVKIASPAPPGRHRAHRPSPLGTVAPASSSTSGFRASSLEAAEEASKQAAYLSYTTGPGDGAGRSPVSAPFGGVSSSRGFAGGRSAPNALVGSSSAGAAFLMESSGEDNCLEDYVDEEGTEDGQPLGGFEFPDRSDEELHDVSLLSSTTQIATTESPGLPRIRRPIRGAGGQDGPRGSGLGLEAIKVASAPSSRRGSTAHEPQPSSSLRRRHSPPSSLVTGSSGNSGGGASMPPVLAPLIVTTSSGKEDAPPTPSTAPPVVSSLNNVGASTSTVAATNTTTTLPSTTTTSSSACAAPPVVSTTRSSHSTLQRSTSHDARINSATLAALTPRGGSPKPPSSSPYMLQNSRSLHLDTTTEGTTPPASPATGGSRKRTLSLVGARRLPNRFLSGSSSNGGGSSNHVAGTPISIDAYTPRAAASDAEGSSPDTPMPETAPHVIQLPRGGVVVQTSAGSIQFGIPPETIKDTLSLGMKVPSIFVVPYERFDTRRGLNMCEVEFPGYYSFFLQKRSTTLVLTREAETALRPLLHETLMGPPKAHLFVKEEMAAPDPELLSGPKLFTAVPNHERELDHFVKPREGRTIDVDTLYHFLRFEPGEPPDTPRTEESFSTPPENEEEEEDEEETREVFHTTVGLRKHSSHTGSSMRSGGTPYLIAKIPNSTVEIHQPHGGGGGRAEEWLVYDGGKELCKIHGHWLTQSTSAMQPPTNSHEGFFFNSDAVLKSSPASPSYLGRTAAAATTTTTGAPESVTSPSSLASGVTSPTSESQAPGAPSSPSPPGGAAGETTSQLSSPMTALGGDRFSFSPPLFGVTVLGSSHGFDYSQSTSGFVIWIHGKGIMVDPPPNATDLLRRSGIPPGDVKTIILTHCHADHDAGTFQKILCEGRVTLMTTKTIMASFLRKYRRISGFTEAFLCRLFEPRIVKIGETIFHAGGFIKFFYSLHALPCVGFVVSCAGKTFAYSADTYYDPKGLGQLRDEGVLSQERYEALMEFPFSTTDVLLHEAGIPPIHTPVEALQALPEEVKERLYVIHIAEAAARKSGLRLARAGTEHTIRIVDYASEEEARQEEMAHLLEVLDKSELFFPVPSEHGRVVAQAAHAHQLARLAQFGAHDTQAPSARDFDWLDAAVGPSSEVLVRTMTTRQRLSGGLESAGPLRSGSHLGIAASQSTRHGSGSLLVPGSKQQLRLGESSGGGAYATGGGSLHRSSSATSPPISPTNAGRRRSSGLFPSSGNNGGPSVNHNGVHASQASSPPASPRPFQTGGRNTSDTNLSHLDGSQLTPAPTSLNPPPAPLLRSASDRSTGSSSRPTTNEGFPSPRRSHHLGGGVAPGSPHRHNSGFQSFRSPPFTHPGLLDVRGLDAGDVEPPSPMFLGTRVVGGAPGGGPLGGNGAGYPRRSTLELIHTVHAEFTVTQAADLVRLSRVVRKQAGTLLTAPAGFPDTHMYILVKGFGVVEDNEHTRREAEARLREKQRREDRTGEPAEEEEEDIDVIFSSSLFEAPEAADSAIIEAGFCFGKIHTGQGLPRRTVVRALTDVTMVQFDPDALKYLLRVYPALQRRLQGITHARSAAAWATVDMNTCMSRLASFQRYQLLGILREINVKAGTQLWTAGVPTTHAYIVAEGELVFEELREALHDQPPFTTGSWLCDVASLLNQRALRKGDNVDAGSIVTLVTETDCRLYAVTARDALAFLERNPGVLVQSVGSLVVE